MNYVLLKKIQNVRNFSFLTERVLVTFTLTRNTFAIFFFQKEKDESGAFILSTNLWNIYISTGLRVAGCGLLTAAMQTNIHCSALFYNMFTLSLPFDVIGFHCGHFATVNFIKSYLVMSAFIQFYFFLPRSNRKSRYFTLITFNTVLVYPIAISHIPKSIIKFFLIRLSNNPS